MNEALVKCTMYNIKNMMPSYLDHSSAKIAHAKEVLSICNVNCISCLCELSLRTKHHIGLIVYTAEIIF